MKYVLIILVAVLAGIVGVWTGDREPPVTITSVKIPDQSAGDSLQINIALERHRACRVSITRVIYDAQRTRFTTAETNYDAPPGPMGYDSYRVIVKLNSGLAVGPGQYSSILTFVCNPFHLLFPIVVRTPEVPFLITPGGSEQNNSSH